MLNLFRDPQGKDRTRADRGLRKSAFTAYGVLICVGLAWVYGSGLLPLAWQPYVVPALGVLVVLPAYWLFLSRKADWQNRATRSDEEAEERRRRAAILGGEAD